MSLVKQKINYLTKDGKWYIGFCVIAEDDWSITVQRDSSTHVVPKAEIKEIDPKGGC